MPRPNRLLSGVLGFILGGGVVLAVMSAGPDSEDVAIGTSASTTPERERTTTTLPRTTTTRATTTTAPQNGTRSNPTPLGGTATRSDGNDPLWDIQVVSFQEDATAAVMAENPAQDPPAEGEQYAIVRVRATYRGETEPARLGTEVSFEAVDDSNVAYDYNDECLIFPDPLDSFNDVFTGGTIEGNLCWSVNSETASSLLLALGAGGFGGAPFFMALQ